MEISRELAIVIGTGIALLILREVFAFVRWILKKNPGSKGDDNTLKRIEEKLDGVGTDMGQFKVDMGIVKTKVDFFVANKEARQKELKEVTEKLAEIPQKYADQMLKCEKRFGKIEGKVKSK